MAKYCINYMIYIMFLLYGQIALPDTVGQHTDLNAFCAAHQTEIGLFKKILERQSVKSRIQIGAVQYLPGSGAIAPEITESVRSPFWEIQMFATPEQFAASSKASVDARFTSAHAHCAA